MTRSILSRSIALSLVTVGAIACARPTAGARPVSPDTLATKSPDHAGKTLAQLFQGRAGVTVINESGGIRLRIRGSGDWDGRGDPLFVIDGVPTEPPGGILMMNPNDIASIEILKDDASTSVYGLRGANGVVKITTRRR
ncbi:MAG TPA: TonB-dependent receptor plug domain-containing protein [Gemmatimonadaceae bacterium]|nr:TonB-dependent receptor plug domain-containing protein [Gemmatimonadaceae bacterium]